MLAIIVVLRLLATTAVYLQYIAERSVMTIVFQTENVAAQCDKLQGAESRVLTLSSSSVVCYVAHLKVLLVLPDTVRHKAAVAAPYCSGLLCSIDILYDSAQLQVWNDVSNLRH
jgi:hypothetical protein